MLYLLLLIPTLLSAAAEKPNNQKLIHQGMLTKLGEFITEGMKMRYASLPEAAITPDLVKSEDLLTIYSTWAKNFKEFQSPNLKKRNLFLRDLLAATKDHTSPYLHWMQALLQLQVMSTDKDVALFAEGLLDPCARIMLAINTGNRAEASHRLTAFKDASMSALPLTKHQYALEVIYKLYVDIYHKTNFKK